MSVQISIHALPLDDGIGYVCSQLSIEMPYITGGRSASINVGRTSVFAIRDEHFDSKSNKLSFNPSDSDFLIQGFEDSVIFLSERESCEAKPKAVVEGVLRPIAVERPIVNVLENGDRSFLAALNSLPNEVEKVGIELLKLIREQSPGELQKAQDGKYINSPDNFWTIKPQYRDKSIAITAREGVDYEFFKNINVKKDRPGYIRFKIKEPSQISEAKSAIISARRRKY